MAVHIFGIRHHGAGCARSLVAALHALKPDAVLIEGPPDAKDMLAHLGSEQLVPPVALLVYPSEEPGQAVYYPFALFSPEWQALQYGQAHKLETRFIDMPLAIRMGEEKAALEQAKKALDKAKAEAAEKTPATDPKQADDDEAAATDASGQEKKQIEIYEDPLSLLARAAGYQDGEEWWERQIEQRRDARELFAAISHAMCTLRSELGEKEGEGLRREAFMRSAIRAAENDGFRTIAVVCGAWHVPALLDYSEREGDVAMLKAGSKPLDMTATWIPWTHSRLSYRSGYGAGILSPGWYEHLWQTPALAPLCWVVRAAQLLRSEDLDASSASVIETVRLSEALAAMRELPMPGLSELNESIRTVLCFGDETPLRLIKQKLEIGEKIGNVPDATPTVPLQKDLEEWQRRLKLKPATEDETKDLDLRVEVDRDKSRLLHRLNLLDIPWGTTRRTGGKVRGTFHEIWQLKWDVTYAVKLIEASRWGNTIEVAAGAYARHLADTADNLGSMTELLERCMLAELPAAMTHILARIQAESARSSDVAQLMQAMAPLTRTARYGNVRGTDTGEASKVFAGLFARVVVGLPNACYSLDDDAAAGMASGICLVQISIDTLNNEEWQSEWRGVLQKLMARDNVHGLLRGCCCRLLFDKGLVDEFNLESLARMSLSAAVPPLQASTWLEGFLAGRAFYKGDSDQGAGGGVQQLLYQDGLWRVLDRWLGELPEDTFANLLPLLRRSFSRFDRPERRKIGEKISQLKQNPQASSRRPDVACEQHLDEQRAREVLPVLAQILGVKQ